VCVCARARVRACESGYVVGREERSTCAHALPVPAVHFGMGMNSGNRAMIDDPGKTGVTADRDKIEFRLLNSGSIFNITLREE